MRSDRAGRLSGAAPPVKGKAHKPLDMPTRHAYIPATFQSSLMTLGASLPAGASGAQRRIAMAYPPLMPKATAVWLVENTALSFEQVADFCKLHPLEVKAIADGDAAQGIKRWK